MNIATEIERYAQTAKAGASRRLSRHKRRQIVHWKRHTSSSQPAWIPPGKRSFSPAQILEEAIFTTLEFSTLTNQTALFLLREMEMTQSYRELGYPTLREWAHAKLTPVKSEDTVTRLCGVTLSLVASLDADPVITSDGEKITGLELILKSNPSAAMKVYGMFADSTNGLRDQIASDLMTGTSDANRIKQHAGREPRIGRALAVYTYSQDDEGEIMVDIHITGSYAQSKVIEKAIDWITTPRFTPHD